MSIWEGMKFLGLSNIEDDLAEEVQEWVKNDGKALIESLNAIFKSDTCVVDLESEADTIIYTYVGISASTTPMWETPCVRVPCAALLSRLLFELMGS